MNLGTSLVRAHESLFCQLSPIEVRSNSARASNTAQHWSQRDGPPVGCVACVQVTPHQQTCIWLESSQHLSACLVSTRQRSIPSASMPTISITCSSYAHIPVSTCWCCTTDTHTHSQFCYRLPPPPTARLSCTTIQPSPISEHSQDTQLGSTTCQQAQLMVPVPSGSGCGLTRCVCCTGGLILSAGDDGKVFVWDTRAEAAAHQLQCARLVAHPHGFSLVHCSRWV